MGWQDAPIVPDAAAAPPAQPAWMRAPVVGTPPVPPAPRGIADTVPGSPEEAAAIAAAPPPAPAPQSDRWADNLANFLRPVGGQATDTAIGAAETGLSGLTNVVGKIAGGATGIADMAGNLVANPFREQPIDPVAGAANTSRAVEDWFTYHPGEQGQALMAPVQEGLGAVMAQLPQDPASQTAVPAFADLAASLAPVKPGVTAGVGALERMAPRPSVAPGEGLGTALQDLRAAGYPVRPSDVQRFNPGKEVPGTTREKFAPEDTRHRLTLESQTKTQDIAARELGLEPGKRLDENFESLKAPEIETYRLAEDVAAQGEMLPELKTALADGAAIVRRELKEEGGAPSVTRTISALRRRANKELNDDRIEVQDRGFDTMAAADRIEAAFGKQLESVGEPQMIERYQVAREKLAKIHDVENASRAGIVDAAKLRKLDEKFPDRLTGGLKMIAKANEYLPDTTGSTMSSAGRPGGAFDLPHTRTGMLSRAAEALVRRIPGMDVTTPEFQAKHFGTEAPPDFISRYGRQEVPAATAPVQGDLGLGEALIMEAPPGVVPTRPTPLMPKEQAPLDLGGAPILEPPPGRVGEIPPTIARDLGDVLIGDEPLLEQAPRHTQREVGFPPEQSLGEVMQNVEKAIPRRSVDQPLPDQTRSAPIRTRGAAEDVPEGRATAANDNFGAEAGRDLPSAARKTLDDLSNAPTRDDLLKSLDAMALQGAALPKPVMRSLHDLRELLRDKSASPREILDAKDGLESDLRQFLGD